MVLNEMPLGPKQVMGRVIEVTTVLLILAAPLQANPISILLWFSIPVMMYLSLLFVLYILEQSCPINIDSMTQFSDSRQSRLLHWLLGINVKDCGCLFMDDNSERDGADVKETTLIWLRIPEDEQIKYRASERQHVRCGNCGSHYQRVEKTGRAVTYSKGDPEGVPGGPREIVDAEVV